MAKLIKSLFLAVAVTLLFFGSVQADTMVLNFSMWIDHNDTLIIDGNNRTLQWYYHGAYAPVGLWDGRNLQSQVPTEVTITNNGTSLVDHYQWAQWTSMPAYWTPAYSSTLSIPALPATYDSIDTLLSGRNSITFTGTNYPYMTVDVYDGDAGASWYSAQITINYTPTAPVPAPAAFLLFAPGLACLAALRRRFIK